MRLGGNVMRPRQVRCGGAAGGLGTRFTKWAEFHNVTSDSWYSLLSCQFL